MMRDLRGGRIIDICDKLNEFVSCSGYGNARRQRVKGDVLVCEVMRGVR